ncbi:MAG: helix-turn-helix domain containing protein [Sphingomonas taxi]
MNEPGICCGALRTKSEERRARVIDAARKLFVDNGFHATGIAQIARESGVAVGQLYRDFASKEEIVAAIVTTDCCTFMAADSLRLAIGDGDERQVREWIHQFVMPEDDIDDSRLFAEIMAEAARNARIAAIFDTVHEDVRGLMLNALAMLAPGDALAERRSVLADTILTMSLGLLHHQLVRPRFDVMPLADAFAVMIDRDIDALRAEAAAPA